MKNFLLVPLMAVAWLCACRQEPLPQDPPLVPIDYTVLPPITQTGANTFGCLVNGEVWVPRVKLGVPWYSLAASLHEEDGKGSGIISSRLLTSTVDDFFSMAFAANYFHSVTYQTSLDTNNLLWFNPDFRHNHENYGHVDGDTSNYMKIIAIDTTKNIISGIFQCTLFNDNKTKTLRITEGRFDLLYYSE